MNNSCSIKCCLYNCFNKSLEDRYKQQIIEEIQKWVVSISKIIHRMSLIFNRFIMHCLQHDIEFPKFDSSLSNGLAKVGIKKSSRGSKKGFDELLNDIYENEFYDFPKMTRYTGDFQAVNYASQTYMTNFKVCTVTAFFSRQKNHIRLWCKINHIDPSHIYRILCEINGWSLSPSSRSHDIELSPMEKDFIDCHREYLNHPTNLHTYYLEKNIDGVLKYYYSILDFYTKNKIGKKFTLVPISKIKAHHIRIDAITLFNILKKINYNVDDASKRVNKDTMQAEWRQIFDIDRFETKNRKFDYGVMTDGIAISLLFTKNKKQQVSSENQKQLNQRLISIDPGRSNLITAYDWSNKKTYTLTGKQYYKEAGMTKRFKETQKYDMEVAHIIRKLSLNPIKSIVETDIYGYTQTIIRNYDKLWQHYTEKKRRRWDFTVFSRKQKVFSTFFKKFQNGDKTPVTVAYGAASFGCNGKGELSVPVKNIANECTKRFQTHFVDEYNTTKMCSDCHHKTHEVGYKKRIDEKKCHGKIRGLRWCPICRKLLNRDVNAAKNIGICFSSLENERPKYLSRTLNSQALPPVYIVEKRERIADSQLKAITSLKKCFSCIMSRHYFLEVI